MDHERKSHHRLAVASAILEDFLKSNDFSSDISSIGDNQSSASQLTDIIRQLLESNEDNAKRSGHMESKCIDGVSTIVQTACNSVREETIEDDESIVTVWQLEANPYLWRVYGI